MKCIILVNKELILRSQRNHIKSP